MGRIRTVCWMLNMIELLRVQRTSNCCRGYSFGAGRENPTFGFAGTWGTRTNLLSGLRRRWAVGDVVSDDLARDDEFDATVLLAVFGRGVGNDGDGFD